MNKLDSILKNNENMKTKKSQISKQIPKLENLIRNSSSSPEINSSLKDLKDYCQKIQYDPAENIEHQKIPLKPSSRKPSGPLESAPDPIRKREQRKRDEEYRKKVDEKKTETFFQDLE
ncbi:hypothetical protein AKJ66_02405 [candidate division MSBL1 archaeon SCGC-AAA259E22]|uniref:Uncharacterized protein n=1 Tax=candidate division MSBL1 archaeon SCGC-AAA259E22 TaxID=1698265 RepID=A0A133UGE4_9EURY|nr:hypothetical protein AKJ66_02405 [candidate division MSBL1 archaeon SCGC-AAA259E22]